MIIGNTFSGKFLFLAKGTKRIVFGIHKKLPYLWLSPEWLMITHRQPGPRPKKYSFPRWFRIPIPKWWF